jgi:phage terminase large subunit-like protein
VGPFAFQSGLKQEGSLARLTQLERRRATAVYNFECFQFHDPRTMVSHSLLSGRSNRLRVGEDGAGPSRQLGGLYLWLLLKRSEQGMVRLAHKLLAVRRSNDRPKVTRGLDAACGTCVLGWIIAALAVSPAAGRPSPEKEVEGKPWRTFVDLPLKELRRSVPELHGLEPSEDQTPLAGILEKVGANISSFFRSFPNVTSDEKVEQQTFERDGSIGNSAGASYRYLALPEKGKPEGSLKEYRTDTAGHPIITNLFPFHSMLTIGFTGLPILLNAPCQRESRFRYLGREKWRGRETEVVAFAQEPEKAQPAERAQKENRTVPIFMQGIAWIDSASSQLIALRTDLLQPVAEIGLEQETTLITFEPVDFKQLSAPLLLPREVVVTATWSGESFRNIHTYSNYRLFSVATEETERPLHPK